MATAEEPPPPADTKYRDDSSYPPVDLDNHFFDRASRHSEAPAESEEHDPRMALKRTATVAKRRAHLAKYVKIAVAGASVLCLAALVKVAVARGSSDGAPHSHVSASVAAPQPTQAAQAAVETAPQPQAPAEQAPAEPAAPTPQPEPTAQVAAPAPEPGAAPAETPQTAQTAAETAPAAPADPAAEPDPKAAAKEKNTCRTALERGKLADAIEAGERSVALDPTDSEAWLILGAAYQEKGNIKDARRCYKACIEQGKRGPKYECMAMPH
jgi:Flp pilus assembly protein TadD